MTDQAADRTNHGSGEGRWRRMWLVGLGLAFASVLIVLAVLPLGVRSNAFRERLLQSTMEPIPGELQVDGVDAGWFRPTQVHGVEFQNQRGASLLQVESIVSDRTMAQLIAEPNRLGGLQVFRPRVFWDLDESGWASNWSHFVNDLPGSASSGETPLQGLASLPLASASIEQGALIVSLGEDRQLPWTHVQGRAQNSPAAPHLIDVELDGILPHQALDALLANAPFDLPPHQSQVSSVHKAAGNPARFPVRLQFQLDLASPASPSWRADVSAAELSTHLVGIPLQGLKAQLLSHENDRLELQLECGLAGGTLSGQGAWQRDIQGWRFGAMEPFLWSDARLTPTTAWHFLRYVAPHLAEAGELAGRFDLSLSTLELTGDSMESLRASGTLQMHSGDIRLSPLQQVIEQVLVRIYASLQSPGAAASYENLSVAFDEQEIQFEVADQRVQHKRIHFRIGEARVETTGTVGFAGDLDLQVSVWIPESWVAAVDTLRPIAGEPLEFRVRGSLRQPEIDEAEIVQLIEQVGTLVLLENAAKQLEGTFLDAFGL